MNQAAGFLLALCLPLCADDAALQEDLLKILRPRYPDAAFRATLNGRTVCCPHSRAYRAPDGLGPGRSGIAVDYAYVCRRWEGGKPLPHSWQKDWRDFPEELGRLPSRNGNGYLEFWIRTPAVESSKGALAALIQVCQVHTAAWEPGPSQRESLFDNGRYGGALNYPGGRHLIELAPTVKETHFTLDEIVDSGLVFLNTDRNQCILIWHSPWEGIGYGDAVLYRQDVRGWRIERVAEHILFPGVILQQGRVIVTRQADLNRKKRVSVFSVPWPHIRGGGEGPPPFRPVDFDDAPAGRSAPKPRSQRSDWEGRRSGGFRLRKTETEIGA